MAPDTLPAEDTTHRPPSQIPHTPPILVPVYSANHSPPVFLAARNASSAARPRGGTSAARRPDTRLPWRWIHSHDSGAPRRALEILGADYGTSGAFVRVADPYPFAIHEAYDTYRVLAESKGKAIGMAGTNLQVIMTGDSAGATIMIGALNELLEHPFGMPDPTSSYPRPTSVPPQPLPLPVAIVMNYAALDFNFTSWMSPAHLRILLEETEGDEARAQGRTPSILGRRSSSYFYKSDEEEDEREGWASEIRGAKDHLSHISPLAVVGDNRRKPRLRRKKSWREALKLGLSKSSTAAVPPNRPALNRRSTTGQFRFGRDVKTDEETDDEDAGADGEREDMEDYGDLPEEDRPIQARVRWNSRTAPSSPVLSKFQNGTGSISAEKSKELLDVEQQAKLEAAVVEADHEVGHRRQREGQEWKKEPIGTRLTMTSRTGYFQDRIISPSMMRAMAILYIGPHLNPDFSTDYRISPILTPARLLARYPPLLMQCGEKDPFVDDTIVFAGRIRDAKRQRKEELRKEIHGRGSHASLRDAVAVAELETELDRLENESENDWVQMQIFSEWSHGYLQMPTLMPEAKAVIRDIADWMDDVFTVSNPRSEVHASGEPVGRATGARSSFVSRLWPWSRAPHVESEDQKQQVQGGEQAGRHSVRISAPHETMLRGHETPFASSGTETENDEGITFVPKARRRSAEGKGSFGSDETVNARDGEPKPDDHSPIHADIKAVDRDAHGGRTHLHAPSTLAVPNGRTNGLLDGKVDAAGRMAVRAGAVRRESDGGVRAVDGQEEAEERVARSRTRSPKSEASTPVRRSGTPGKGGVTGQTISESELIRRRRLLDSHIFVSEQ